MHFEYLGFVQLSLEVELPRDQSLRWQFGILTICDKNYKNRFFIFSNAI